MCVANECSYQEVDVACGWNQWVWLECIDVISGYCCKEVHRFPLTFPYSTFMSFFCSSIPPCSFVKCFFVLVYVIFMQKANDAQRTFEIV